MNIIKRELRSNLKSLIIWGIAVSVFVILITSEFKAYYNNKEMVDLLASMPKELLKAFSMEGANMTTVIGFVSVAGIYYYLMLAIYSGLLGNTILAKEERDKTAEFLMVLPISRLQAIISKLAVAILLSAAINIILVGAIYITTIPYDRGQDFGAFITCMMVGIFLIQMIFLSIGMFFSAVVKRHKSSGWITMGTLFVFYLMAILSGLTEKLENIKYLTPFKYFEASALVKTLKLEPIYIGISIGIIIVALTTVCLVYPKRDLKI